MEAVTLGVVTLLLLLVIYVHSYWRACTVPSTFYKATEANGRVRSALGAALTQPFRPLWWAFNTHLQTIVNVTLRLAPTVEYEREVVRLRDGGQTALDWAQHPDATINVADRPVSLVLTGYTGSSTESEIRILVRQLQEDGFRVAVMHFRGLGSLPLSNPKFGDCAPEDVDDVIDAVRRRTDRDIYGVGVSAGANCLSLYAGVRGPKCRFVALASISNPFNIYQTLGVKLKSNLFSKNIYDPFFVPKRRAVVKRHSEMFLGVKGFDMAAVDAARGAIEFDKAVSLRSTPFETIEEFYAARSSCNVLQGITVPVLFINAADDPFMDLLAYPAQKMLENEHCFGILTARGGHLGFMQNAGLLGLSNRTWDECVASEWLKYQLRVRGEGSKLKRFFN